MSSSVPSLLLAGIKQEETTGEQARALRHYKHQCHGFLPQNDSGSSESGCLSKGNEWQSSSSPASPVISSEFGIRKRLPSTVSNVPANMLNTATNVASGIDVFNAGARIDAHTSALSPFASQCNSLTELQYPKREAENPPPEEHNHASEDSSCPFHDPLRTLERYSCEFCGKTFLRSSRLKRHVDGVHKKLREFACEVCGKASASKGDLNKHVNSVHKAIRPFTCEICGRSFAEMGHVRRHIRSLHNKLREYACEICGKAFAEKGTMNKHVKVVHKGTLFFSEVP
uniref:PR domain zinc finger protein 15 n=1 Tax=Schistocephalus solidus TaxID=70667 RepID=A0A0X3PIS8_SCHSO